MAVDQFHNILHTSLHVFLRLASLEGGPQPHVHMEGMKCRVLKVAPFTTIHTKLG